MFDSVVRSPGSFRPKKKSTQSLEIIPTGTGSSSFAARRGGVCLGLENLEDRTLLSVASPTAHLLPTVSAPPLAGTAPGGLSPAQVRHAYGFDQITFNNGTIVGDGTGQTIAIIDAYDQPNMASDLATFDATFGLAAPPRFTKVNETGGSSMPATAPASWGLEESLDVEWAHAIAPGANILLVEATTNNYSDLFAAANYARNQPGVVAVSMSFGGSEFAGESSFDSNFTTPAGHGGVTFVAATGDSGSSGAPNYPSVSPNVLAVGGTQLSVDGSGNYLGEAGWGGSGGGISTMYAQPGYQAGVVTQSNNHRTVPDVSYNASSGSPYAVYYTGDGGWVQVYGTSAAAPQWAALIAIADQGRALAGKGALDGATQALPAIYQLPASDFHDITSGSNGGFSAGPGYDLVTGRGTPIANAVVAGLVGTGSTGGSGPVITTAAAASPGTVTGTTTGLSVSASDPAGGLTYTWSATVMPSGAKAPTFSANGASAASLSTATFYAAGNYTFLVTVKDAAGLIATSSVGVTVAQTETSVGLTPASSNLVDGSSLQYTATARDQFGSALSKQPTWVWSLGAGGMGSVTTAGLYTAPNTGSGTVTVQASGGGMMGTASVTVGAAGTAPAAPSNLTAQVTTAHQILLNWTINSTNQTGFVIQRSTNGGNWTQIAVVGANVSSYTDSSTSRRKSYSYRVYAYNSSGNSPFSNVTPPVKPSVATVSGKGGPAFRSAGWIVSMLSSVATNKGSSHGAAAVANGSVAAGAPHFSGEAVVSTPSLRPVGVAHETSSATEAFWQWLGSDPVGELLAARIG
jgi:hypothetical protein